MTHTPAEQRESSSTANVDARAPRVTSHALVEVRRYRYIPFFVESAVLLDLSASGFKLEFTGEAEATQGAIYWLNIPLAPLGIYSPKRLVLRTECRWFDEARFRIGGVFVSMSDKERMLLDQVLDVFNGRSKR